MTRIAFSNAAQLWYTICRVSLRLTQFFEAVTANCVVGAFDWARGETFFGNHRPGRESFIGDAALSTFCAPHALPARGTERATPSEWMLE